MGAVGAQVLVRVAAWERGTWPVPDTGTDAHVDTSASGAC